MSNKQLTSGYLLGMDIGNSKTHTLITDLTGNVISFIETGCANYEVVGLEGMAEAMQDAVQRALKIAQLRPTDILSMGFGIAGYDWPSEEPLMVKAIESLAIPGPFAFVNDVVLGLIAGSPEGWGIAVDAGTGNNVRGRDKMGKSGRITGNSIRFGEFGGSGELVWCAMIAAIYAWSKRGPKTQISHMLMDFFEIDNEDDLIEGLAMDKLHLSPILAKEIFRLAKEGDQAANEVVSFSARELGLNVNAVIRQLHFQDQALNVILLGSVFDAGEIFIKPFSKEVHTFAPKAKFIKLTVPPVVGAVLLAGEKINYRNLNFRDYLMESTRKAIPKE